VTHDQAEAMVISDRIAVLERGRVAQVGTADEVFLRPRTRFVAEFIGRTNLIDGVAVEPDVIARGPLRLAVAAAGLPVGARVAVSIRPHDIALSPANDPAPAAGDRGARRAGASTGATGSPRVNALRGVIQRVSFLGEGVDYLVQVLDSDTTLRVTTPAQRRLAVGDDVVLAIDRAACIALPEDDARQ
jgi:ABC-type Fe3+/spermidine/putrescine transport system ATPase subunit